jgi:hypothetical protein
MQQAEDDESDSDYVPRPEGEQESDSASDGKDETGGKRPRLGDDGLESGEGAESAEERKARLQR